jgi:sulfur carrier protein
MTIIINGKPREVRAATLDAVLAELGYAGAHVATAHRGEFVPATGRAACTLAEGDRVEILSPIGGG